MSEEGFHIQQTEDGEVSASYSPTKISSSNTAEESGGKTEAPDSGVETAQLLELETVDENLSRIPDGSPGENETKSDQASDHSDGRSGTKSISFGEPLSTSTPVTKREAAVLPVTVTDNNHQNKDRSATADSVIGMDAEGENASLSDDTSCSNSHDDPRECPDHGSLNNIWIVPQSDRKESLMLPGSIRVPIIGHETMEARAKFTIFKIHVMVEDDENGWFLFRRYSDFVYLNDQLKVLFPNFRLALPPKRWFRSNFDPEFLEERQIGLQAFLDNVTGHRDICSSQPVREFFCFDDPPAPQDSLEMSKAQCENLEDTVYLLRKELTEKDTEIELLREEMDLYKNQVKLLTNRLSELNRLTGSEKSGFDKRNPPTDVKQYDIDELFGAGDVLLTNKLASDGSELRNSDVDNGNITPIQDS